MPDVIFHEPFSQPERWKQKRSHARSRAVRKRGAIYRTPNR